MEQLALTGRHCIKNSIIHLIRLYLTNTSIFNKNETASFLKITARNFGIIPPDYSGEGNPAWLFVDEIMVE